MSDAPSDPPIPWRVELQATLRDGYICRRCRRVVTADDDRRIVVINRHAIPEAGNVLTLCERCATLHQAGR